MFSLSLARSNFLHETRNSETFTTHRTSNYTNNTMADDDKKWYKDMDKKKLAGIGGAVRPSRCTHATTISEQLPGGFFIFFFIATNNISRKRIFKIPSLPPSRVYIFELLDC